MEQKIQNIVDEYLDKFRAHICAEFPDAKSTVEKYPKLLLTKNDFIVKKESPQVEENERCIAKRADGTQCTRKRKKGCELCGTHEKVSPYGKIDKTEKPKIEYSIRVQEVQGIPYYIDEEMRVYNTEDVLENRENPRIIGKYFSDRNMIELY